jgi:hypothetical protein
MDKHKMRHHAGMFVRMPRLLPGLIVFLIVLWIVGVYKLVACRSSGAPWLLCTMWV